MPLIVLSLSPAAVLGLGNLIVLVLAIVGSVGMLTRRSALSTFSSCALLGLIVWGRVASDLWGLGGLDTALLLLEFLLVILVMEVSNTVILFDSMNRKLEDRSGELSFESRVRLVEWARSQLLGLGKMVAAAFVLSLSLLVIGDLLSVSINQIVFSAILVVVALAALLVLATFGREPEDRLRPRSESSASHTS